MEWCHEAGWPGVWEDDWELSNKSQVNADFYLFVFLLFAYSLFASFCFFS